MEAKTDQDIISTQKEEELIQSAYVSVSRGNGKSFLMPLEDYLENEADRYGFNSYKDLKKAGYNIDFPPLLNEDGTPMVKSELEKNTDKKIIEDIKRSGFQPNKQLVENIKNCGDISLKEISEMYKSNTVPEDMKESIDKIVAECRGQELALSR